MSLLSDLGTKVGAEFKAHRLRIEDLETGKIDTIGGTVDGMLNLATTFTGEEDWMNSPITIRERERHGVTDLDIKYSPNLNFHWAGKKSRSLYMDSLGDLYYGEYDANGNPIGNKIADTDGLFLENVNATTLGGISATEYARKSTTLSYQDASTTAHYPYQMKQEDNGDLSIGYYNNGWKNALLLNASGISYRDSNSTSHTVYHSGNLPELTNSTATPSFNAYSPAAQTVNGADIVYGSTRFNNGNSYNTTTGRFTAPKTGYYHFSFSVLVNTTGPGYTRVYWNINGSTGSQWGDTLEGLGGATWGSAAMSTTVFLNAGDYVSVRNGGNNTYGTSYGHFAGHYLGY